MKTKSALLLMTLLASMSLSAFAQSSGRSPISVTAIGHMAVTLLSPAALSVPQNLEFNNIQLRSSEVASGAVDCDMKMATVRVSGTRATYSVTVSNDQMGFNQNGNRLSVGNFSTSTSMEDSGSSSIYIGATMSIAKRGVVAIANNNGSNNPLAITINYN